MSQVVLTGLSLILVTFLSCQKTDPVEGESNLGPKKSQPRNVSQDSAPVVQYEERISIDTSPISQQSQTRMGYEDIRLSFPIDTSEEQGFGLVAEDGWTWKLSLEYPQNASSNRVDQGDLEIVNGKASLAVKSVPVGKVNLKLDIAKETTLVYKGEGTAEIISGQSTNATMKMTKVNKNGDLNINPEFDKEPDDDAAPESDREDDAKQDAGTLPTEFSGWDLLSHKVQTGWTISDAVNQSSEE